MYLGQATIYQDRVEEFLSVAKSLEIKELSKDNPKGESDDQNEDKIFEESNEFQTTDTKSNTVLKKHSESEHNPLQESHGKKQKYEKSLKN